MAREQKPLPTEHKNYYCKIGNHRCYRHDLAVTDKGGQYGLCRACIRQQTRGCGLRNYWTSDKTLPEEI